MSSNSEARKRQEAVVAQDQRRRDVMQQALAEVYPGAEFVDADALLDQLSDLGASVEVSG